MGQWNWPLVFGWAPPYGPPAAGEPCPNPTIHEFRDRFPEFADTSDAQVQLAIDDTSCMADTSWDITCVNCKTAKLFLAAHYLALMAFAAEALAHKTGATIDEGGKVTSIAFDIMKVGFSSPQFKAAMSTGQYDLNSTPYGARYLGLLRLSQPAVWVV